MLVQRLIVIGILVPIGVLFALAGGWVLTLFVAASLAYAAWEYWHMFSVGGYHPSAPILIGGVAGLVITRHVFHFLNSDLFFSVVILMAMAVQIVNYEKGHSTTAVDFNITLGGILYLGWLGSYVISLRALPDGFWWLLLVLPSIWFADGGAYLIGSQFGRHKLNKRVSPNKSWEGYVGGIISAALGTMLLALLWNLFSPAITPVKGLLIGIIISSIAPLGDLGESMLKRNFGLKDTSHLLPGHGGIMDRIDSWLWAAPIGYYLIIWAWL